MTAPADQLLWAKVVMLLVEHTGKRRKLLRQDLRIKSGMSSPMYLKRDTAAKLLRSLGITSTKHFRLFYSALKEDIDEAQNLMRYRIIRDQYMLLVETVNLTASHLHDISSCPANILNIFFCCHFLQMLNL